MYILKACFAEVKDLLIRERMPALLLFITLRHWRLPRSKYQSIISVILVCIKTKTRNKPT